MKDEGELHLLRCARLASNLPQVGSSKHVSQSLLYEAPLSLCPAFFWQGGGDHACKCPQCLHQAQGPIIPH